MSEVGGEGAAAPLFESHEEAALVIAQYWQGEAPVDLLRSIQGLGDPEVYKLAIRYAREATEQDEAARAAVQAADSFLWSGYEAGSGVHKLMARETFSENFDFAAAIEATREQGYFFADNALAEVVRKALEAEADGLPLEVGDHITNPLNAGKPNEIRQQHARLYTEYGDPQTPAANFLIECLAETVRSMRQFPELDEWQLTEIGYQRYRHSNDFIGAHRDRVSDMLLSFTCAINGSAPVRIFETLGEHDDYSLSQLRIIDEFVTTPGNVMLLRAPGFGSGEQVVHEVLPPVSPSRLILNLRMRPSVLEQPDHPKWQAQAA